MHRQLIGALAAMVVSAGAGLAAETEELPQRHWSFAGIFGTFDRAAARRGFEVYRNVCASCHSMSLLHYRDLTQLGYSEDEVKAIAAEQSVTAGPNDQGEMFERPARPADPFKAPFPNPEAARAANNGALPPDLSLMVEARRGGGDYVFGVLTGYAEAPADVTVPESMYYNRYFSGHLIAMPPPLTEGAVSYADGTQATLPQEASDIVTFLAWSAEPKLEERRRMGVKVVLFLIVFTGLLYAVKRKVWLGVGH
jgi:ubiquinol-cytochrome c reductase cytochrome c1 subunit